MHCESTFPAASSNYAIAAQYSVQKYLSRHQVAVCFPSSLRGEQPDFSRIGYGSADVMGPRPPGKAHRVLEYSVEILFHEL